MGRQPPTPNRAVFASSNYCIQICAVHARPRADLETMIMYVVHSSDTLYMFQ